MLDYLTRHLDNSYSVDVIYLQVDFQKAFNTVPHQRLLNKLASFDIHGNVLKWIESFLTNIAESNKLYLMAINFDPSQLLVVFHRVLCWDLYYSRCS